MRIKYHPDGTVTLIPANKAERKITSNGEYGMLIDKYNCVAAIQKIDNLMSKYGQRFCLGGALLGLDSDEKGNQCSALYVLWSLKGEKEFTCTKIEI